MSVIESIKSAIAPLNKNVNSLLGPQVAARLAQAKAALTDMRREHAQLALSVESGETDADKRMADWRARVAAAEARVIDLEAAHRAAIEGDAAMQQERLAKTREAAIRSVTQKLALAHKASGKLRAAVENYSIAFREMERFIADAGVTAREAKLPWEGAHRDQRTGEILSYQEGASTTMEARDNLYFHVELEFLRVGHGPELGGTFPTAVPGAMSYSRAEGKLSVDPMDNSDMPLRGDGGLHDHDAPAHGKPVLFGAVLPIDERFDRQRQRLIALVKGETYTPPPLPPGELFIGTTAPEPRPFAATTPTTITPSGPVSDGIDATVKIQAEREVRAMFGEKWDAFCQAKYGVGPSGLPRDRWLEYVRDCDLAAKTNTIPGSAS